MLKIFLEFPGKHSNRSFPTPDAPQISITYVNQSELQFELDANPAANFEILFEASSRNEPTNKRISAFKVLHQERVSPTRIAYTIRFSSKLSEQEIGDYLVVARNSINTTYGEFRPQSEFICVLNFEICVRSANACDSLQMNRRTSSPECLECQCIRTMSAPAIRIRSRLPVRIRSVR